MPNSACNLWHEKSVPRCRQFSTEETTPENNKEGPLQEETALSESESPASESAASLEAVLVSEPPSSEVVSNQTAPAPEISPEEAISTLGAAPTPEISLPTESPPLNGERLGGTSSSEITSSRLPSRITDASDFLASRRFLDEDANREASPRLHVDVKARGKEILKKYRVLLRDTKVDVDLDEVMKVATTEPSPPPPGHDGHRQGPKPPMPSELLPPHLLDAGMKCDSPLPFCTKGTYNLQFATVEFPAATHRAADIGKELLEKQVVLHGYFGPVRKTGKLLYFSSFYDYYSNPPRPLKVVSLIDPLSPQPQITKAAHQILGSLHRFTPVALRATVYKCAPSKSPEKSKFDEEVELRVKEVIPLNSVSENLIYTEGTNFPLENRYLQLRTNKQLYGALRLRSRTASECRSFLEKNDFLEVETPLLFKSTPEGAREFFVPTRKGDGTCYALPQSPQQYKQILMASGIPRYYQLAKCFRDEDLRTDRQPEFTQLDMEMSFATSNDVMDMVERLIISIWSNVLGVGINPGFKRVPYWWTMKNYGTDKPDLRYPGHRVSLTLSILFSFTN